MSKSYKVVHIHTDYKFISGSSIFDGSGFTNEVIIIEKYGKYNGRLNDNYTIFQVTELEKIINRCNNADLVVLYDLERIKIGLSIRLSKHVKIAWRFFGYEIYARNKEEFVSPCTGKYILKSDIKKILKNGVRPIYSLLKTGHLSFDYKFMKAVNRINYILVLSQEEYNLISKFYKLPEFIKLPAYERLPKGLSKDLILAKSSYKTIVIGHSKSSFNNHLDVIKMVDECTTKILYNFTLLFSYGPENNYTQAIRNAIQGKPYFNLVENFLPFDEFNLFYKRISALVINSYRQLAGANIFMAFQCGVKIYLNPNNVYMDWLLNIGFKVYSIEYLKNDIKSNNIRLNEDEMEHNFRVLKSNYEKYNISNFQKEIKMIF